MKQKLLCINQEFGEVKSELLQKYLDNGWRIVTISAATISLSTVCWVLLEQKENYMLGE